jgi:hypothetical protein
MKINNLVLLLVMIAIPVVSGFPVPPQDNPTNVEAARKALMSARADLGRSGGNWGGHLEQAVAHIEEAVKEIDAAEKWAKEHHAN